MTMVAIIAVAAATGYWWLNRTPNSDKPDNSGLYSIQIDGKYGFMDRVGKIVIAPQFDAVYGFSEGLSAVRVGTKVGYIDTAGLVVITPQFDEAAGFSEGLAAVRAGSKYGYINTKGLIAITPQFVDVTSFHNGRAAVKTHGDSRSFANARKIGQVNKERFAFIDRDGKFIGKPGLLYVPWPFGNRSEWTGDVTIVRTADDRIGIMNSSGQVSIVDGVDEISYGFTDGLAPAATGGKWGYLDTTGKWVIEPQFEQTFGFKEGLTSVEVGGRWGFIDQKGKFVVNPQYDGLSNFSEGYASFESGKGTIPNCQDCMKEGFLNKRGEVVVAARFLEHPNAENGWSSPVGGFSEGLAAVKTEDGWGFIDTTGQMVIDPQFDQPGSFQDGLAFVRVLGKEGYITKTGAFVVDPFGGKSVRDEKARIAADIARSPSPNNFVGAWWLESGGFLKIVENFNGQVALTEGFEANWRIAWSEPAVSMDFVGGKLQGQITSHNFRATHGAVFDYRLTAELLPSGKLQYSVSSDIGNEVKTATKIPSR